MRRRIVIGAMVTFVAIGGLTACSGDDGERAVPKSTVLRPGAPGEPNQTVVAGPRPPARPTAAEVTFVQMMIPHHEQALEMADLVPKQGDNPKVKALADRINITQKADIAAMKAWLRDHPKDVLKNSKGHGSHTNMPGMATPEQMSRLRSARGAGFDRLFLTLMIPHHEGALTMAKDVLTRGSDVTVQGLAREVLSSQNPEIIRMRDLLAE